MEESDTDGAECSRKVERRRMVEGAIRLGLMLGISSLSVLESCIRHCLCLFLCMALIMLWKERSRIEGYTAGKPQGIAGY